MNKNYTKKVDDEFIKTFPKKSYTYQERGFWIDKLLKLENLLKKKK